MVFVCLACDYDGTLAHDGKVAPDTVAAIERLRSSGRKVILVTGRELDDLQATFSRIELFDWIVAENGALLYQPGSKQSQTLGSPPPEGFREKLRRRASGTYQPIGTGESVCWWAPPLCWRFWRWRCRTSVARCFAPIPSPIGRLRH